MLSRRIWLIGGTQESVNLAAAIASIALPCIVSVTTASARCLYPTAANLQVWVGRLNPTQMLQFLQQQQIVAILDASHPYAVEISESAIALAQNNHIPYLRYERPNVDPGLNSASVINLDSFDTLLAGSYLHSCRVLLTVGYRFLHLFQPWQQRSTLFARILPSAIALTSAFNAGFTPERLICLRPPICADLEKALWRQWQISVVVTKASGTPGGEDIKRSLAAQLGIQLILIDRPVVNYPQQTSDLATAIKFCCQCIANN